MGRTITLSIGVDAPLDRVGALVDWLHSLAVVLDAYADDNRGGIYDVTLALGTDDPLEAEAWVFDRFRSLGFEPVWIMQV